MIKNRIALPEATDNRNILDILTYHVSQMAVK